MGGEIGVAGAVHEASASYVILPGMRVP
jgi:hypothetical protein